jgi:phage tail-like protein
MPQVENFVEGYRANEFRFEIGGHVSPGVSKVTGLSEGELDTIEQADGGTNHVFKISAAKVKFEPLTIERRVDGSEEDKLFREWFQQTFKLNEPHQGGSAVRKSGLVVKSHRGEDVLKFAFFHAWVKSSKFTDLEAGSTSLLIQTIVLEHEGLERVE